MSRRDSFATRRISHFVAIATRLSPRDKEWTLPTVGSDDMASLYNCHQKLTPSKTSHFCRRWLVTNFQRNFEAARGGWFWREYCSPSEKCWRHELARLYSLEVHIVFSTAFLVSCIAHLKGDCSSLCIEVFTSWHEEVCTLNKNNIQSSPSFKDPEIHEEQPETHNTTVPCSSPLGLLQWLALTDNFIKK